MGKFVDIKAFKIYQPIGEFYVGVIDYTDLIHLASTNMDEMIVDNKNDIYQRKLDKTRIPALKKFMSYSRASFPNGIILNSKYSLQYDVDSYKLTIPCSDDTFFIIDGQHRIEALKNYKSSKKFELCIIIFEKLNIDKQTELFVTVNNEQKKVNPTVKINLMHNDEVDTPEKISRNICIAFNEDKESPFYNLIKVTDRKDSDDCTLISMAAFTMPIIQYIYDRSDYYVLKDVLLANKNDRSVLRKPEYYKNGEFYKKCFWDFYSSGREDIIYSILFNYFDALKSIFKTDWGSANSILCKTSGYNAIMLLFKEIIGNFDLDYSYAAFIKLLKPLKKFNGNLNLEKVGVGYAASTRLYKAFLKTLYNIDDVNSEIKTIFDFIEE